MASDGLLPIKNIIVVQDVSKCPKNYTAILTATDTGVDARETYGLLKRKRYLCYTRHAPQTSEVLCEIILCPPKASVEPGFSVQKDTYDSKKRIFDEKVILTKLCNLNNTKEYIVDIVIHEDHQPPRNFQRIGRWGKLYISVRKVSTPVFDEDHISSKLKSRLKVEGENQLSNLAAEENTLSRSCSWPVDSAVEGVPFCLRTDLQPLPRPYLNSKTVETKGQMHMNGSFRFKSHLQLENEFSYNFRLERDTHLNFYNNMEVLF